MTATKRQPKRGIKKSWGLRVAQQYMEQHLSGTDWRFMIKPITKRRIGECSYRYKLLCVNEDFLNVLTRAEFRDTVLHEIAHALTPDAGHGPVWVAKAKEIGCTGQRCGDRELAVAKQAEDINNGDIKRYLAICKSCGKEHFKARSSRCELACVCYKEHGVSRDSIFNEGSPYILEFKDLGTKKTRATVYKTLVSNTIKNK